MEPSVKDIQEILGIFLDSELQDLRLEIGSVRLAVSKGGGAGVGGQPFVSTTPVSAAPLSPAPRAPAAPVVTSPAVESPVVGSPAAVAAATSRAQVQKRAGWVAVTAPTVGTFYRCPAPHQPPFVQIGSDVGENDTLCLIEVMKMFTGVTATCKGKVVEILIEDASLVEHGQTLLYIDPA